MNKLITTELHTDYPDIIVERDLWLDHEGGHLGQDVYLRCVAKGRECETRVEGEGGQCTMPDEGMVGRFARVVMRP
jgi:hypothetical protein